MVLGENKFKNETIKEEGKRQRSKIKEEDFVVPSSDPRGRSSLLQFHCLPWIERELQEILLQRKFPFRTKADIIRWAVLWGLQRLDTFEPSPGFLAWAEDQIQLLRDELYRAESSTYERTLDALVEYHLKEGTNVSMIHAALIVQEAYHRAKKIKQTVYKKKMLVHIRNTYPKLLAYEFSRVVSLDPDTFDSTEPVTNYDDEGKAYIVEPD